MNGQIGDFFCCQPHLFFGLLPLPGHGGFDPGKVGVNQSLEKDINLAIGKKLSDILASNGYTVYMTRTEDVALCQGDERFKKMTERRFYKMRNIKKRWRRELRRESKISCINNPG